MESLRRIFATFLACIVTGASAFAIGNSIIAARHSICVAENANNQTLTGLLSFFEGRTLSNRSLTPQQRAETIDFYQASLKKIPPQKSC